MSVLINGMKMPKDCPYCKMAHYNASDEFTGCAVVPDKRYAMHNDAVYAKSTQRPDWCPLVEIPEPHGDLIDRDALVKDLTNGIKARLLLDGYEEYQNINNTDDCVECVKYADAVIEAEGRDE